MPLIDSFIERAAKNWQEVGAYALAIVIGALLELLISGGIVEIYNTLGSVLFACLLAYTAVKASEEGYLAAMKNAYVACVLMVALNVLMSLLLLPVEAQKAGYGQMLGPLFASFTGMCFMFVVVPFGVLFISAIFTLIFGSIGYAIAIFLLKKKPHAHAAESVRATDTTSEATKERKKAGR
jgi:hypothetical protein